MIQNSDIPTSSSSSSSNQQQQPKILNRMSDFLFQKRQRSLLQEEYPETSSSTSPMLTSSIHGGAPSYYSGMDEDNASRVDSMFSSIQSNQSNMRPNPNTPPPIRTVRLDGGIVHRPGGPLPQHITPTPPRNSTFYNDDDEQPDDDNDDDYEDYYYEDDDDDYDDIDDIGMEDTLQETTSPTTTTTPTTTTSTTSSHTPLETKEDLANDKNRAADDGFNEAFAKMAHEYGLPEDVAKTLSPEAKQVLLRNSQANLQQNNTNGFFSWRTWGKKDKHRMDVLQNQFFDPSTTSNNNNLLTERKNNKRGHGGNSINNNRKKAYSTSARAKSQRIPIMSFHQDNNNNTKKSTKRYDLTMKKGLSPEYFIHLLKDCHVRELDESQVQDLRVCLRSVKASWTTEFLELGGYLAISNLFRQMNQAPKRSPNDDKILQHLAKCFKAIMTHEQAGIAIVLTNPVGLEYIRDLLFGPVNQKQRALYSLSVITRAHFLNILCTLANLQTTQTETVPYIHGYDVLRRLLLDCPSTTQDTTGGTAMESNTSSSSQSSNQSTEDSFPFRMTLKEDPQTVMKLILENDPFYSQGQPFKPRYTAWMRELQYTVEKEIEPITFLAQVLDYKFESAFRQLRIKPPTPQQQQQKEQEEQALEQEAVEQKEEGTGSVMVDDGVAEYLIAHLRLINTIVATQPTFYTGPYDDRDREKVRLEIMMSGFDKIAKALQSCPHPTLYAFYFRYLQPLLQPLADISTQPSSPS
ncbi:armadillo-type protein [Halteromyces radiatus]|uniref:armadillo-type protein n=1 Tax=Halteromyces radiatus TaxID=101107 RepID=UPI00221F2F36|nr:armadillo-type protein [Halteromyces radiatus]KAI8093621.1 armadillo-type protein [Halteromyces radiatus]